MTTKTKADLQKEIEILKSNQGHIINNCNITAASPDETKIAVAKAVEEGMKALQSLGGNSYGIYIGK